MHVLSLPFFGLVVGSVLLYWFVVPARWRVALLALVRARKVQPAEALSHASRKASLKLALDGIS